MSLAVWVIVPISVAALNIVATVMLIRSNFETTFQKLAQGFLIWAIPVIGAILIIAVLTNTRNVSRSRTADAGLSTNVMSGADADPGLHSSNVSPWGGDAGHSG